MPTREDVVDVVGGDLMGVEQARATLDVPKLRTKVAAFLTASRTDLLWKALPGLVLSVILGWLVTASLYTLLNKYLIPLDVQPLYVILENARDNLRKEVPAPSVISGSSNQSIIIKLISGSSELAVVSVQIDVDEKLGGKQLRKLVVTLMGAASTASDVVSKPIVLFERAVETPPILFGSTHAVMMPASVHALQKALNAFPKILTSSPKVKANTALAINEDELSNYMGIIGRNLKPFESLGSDFNWSRRLNGKIQFMSVWAFWVAMIQMLSRMWLHCALEKRVRGSTLTRELWADNELFDERLVQSLLMTCKMAQEELGKRSRFGFTYARSAYLEIYHAAVAAFKVEGDYKSVPAFVDSQAAIIGDERNAGLGFIKYLIWSIPSLGFIGTVVGIGDALLETVNVDSLDVAESVIAKSMVSSNIGVAFDTTLVALLLSMIAMLTYYLLLQYENLIIHSATEDAMRRFVKPGKVIPSSILTSQLIDAIGNAHRASKAMGSLSNGLERYAKAGAKLANQMNAYNTSAVIMFTIILLLLGVIIGIEIWRML